MRLPATLYRLRSYLADQAYSSEIIVVSNGSSDGTDEVVRSTIPDMPGLQLITLAGKGKGMAVRAGAVRSWGDIVFICDADLSMPPETLPQFMEAIESTDIVIGSREAPGARRFHEPWQRHLMGRIFNYLVRLLAVRGLADTQCGFKAFRREAADDLFGRQFVTGWAFDVELLYLARKFKYSIVEIPIDWYFDTDSRVKRGVDTLNMVGEVMMIRWRSLLGRYSSSRLPATERERDLGR